MKGQDFRVDFWSPSPRPSPPLGRFTPKFTLFGGGEGAFMRRRVPLLACPAVPKPNCETILNEPTARQAGWGSPHRDSHGTAGTRPSLRHFIPRGLSLYHRFVGQRLSLRSGAAATMLPVGRPTRMKLTPTRNQMVALIVLAVVFAILAIMPHWGAPEFRYTGSDPAHGVWNLGWPLATCIHDSAHSPHLFVGPFAYAYAFSGAVGFSMLYAAFVAWNHRGTRRVSTAIEAAR